MFLFLWSINSSLICNIHCFQWEEEEQPTIKTKRTWNKKIEEVEKIMADGWICWRMIGVKVFSHSNRCHQIVNVITNRMQQMFRQRLQGHHPLPAFKMASILAFRDFYLLLLFAERFVEQFNSISIPLNLMQSNPILFNSIQFRSI